MRARLIRLNILILLLTSFPVAGQVETPTLIAQIGRGAVQSVEWYPGGEYVLVSTATGAWIYTYFLQEVAYLPDAHMASISADGRVIAAVNSQNQLVFWDAESLQSIAPLVVEWDWFSRIYDLAWSPDGRFLVITGTYRSGRAEIYTWDISASPEGSGFAIFRVPQYTQLLWSPSGTTLAAYTPGGGGILIQFTPMRYIGSFSNGEETIIRWKDNNTLITLDVEDTLYRLNEWNAITGDHQNSYTMPNEAAVYTPDGRYSAFSGWDQIIIRDALSPQSEYQTPPLIGTSPAYFRRLAWSRDQRYVAAGSWSSLRADVADVVIIDVQEARVLHHWRNALQGISLFAWSPHNRWLLVVDEHQQIAVYEVQSGEQIAYSDQHARVGMTLAWSPVGGQIALGDNLGNVTIYDAVEFTPLYTLTDHPSTVTRIEWQPIGDRIALEAALWVWNSEHLTEIWDISGEAPENITDSFQMHADEPIHFARFSANGERLAIVSGAYVSVWDFTREFPKWVVRDTLDYLPQDVLFSPSGHELVYAQDIYGGAPPDRTQKQQEFWIFLVPSSDRVNTWSRSGELVSLIWDVWDHTYIPEIEPSLVRLPAGGVEDLSSRYFMLDPRLYGSIEAIDRGFISPYGAYVGAVSGDGNGMIWDGQTGSPVAWITNAANMVWSPDETRLVVQRTDGSLWILESEGTILAQIPTPPDMQAAVGDFYWSPNSRQLAHLHDGVIDVWQVSM